LHSQSVQACCQKVAANLADVATAVEVRQQEMSDRGHLQTQSFHCAILYQTVVRKDQALTMLPWGAALTALRRSAATAAAAAAAAVACRVPQRRPASGRGELAGGSRRGMPHAGQRSSGAASAGGW